MIRYVDFNSIPLQIRKMIGKNQSKGVRVAFTGPGIGMADVGGNWTYVRVGSDFDVPNWGSYRAMYEIPSSGSVHYGDQVGIWEASTYTPEGGSGRTITQNGGGVARNGGQQEPPPPGVSIPGGGRTLAIIGIGAAVLVGLALLRRRR